jgi:hypothetical protein
VSSIKSRIEKVERQVGTGREPRVVQVVDFSGGPLPPEEKRGNIITRCVPYESIQRERASNESRSAT